MNVHKMSRIAAGLVLLAAAGLGTTWLPARAAEEPSVSDPTLSVLVVGDVGLNPTNQTVNPKGVYDGGFQTWTETTDRIVSDINADLNFLNVETVVTDRNDLTADRKGQGGPFNFRMHSNGLKHLVAIGFNMLSLANNHSMDYGPEGLLDTLKFAGEMRAKGVVSAGVGKNRDEATRPELLKVKDHTVAFSAMGIVTNNLARHRAGPDTPGQAAYRFDEDFSLVRKRLLESQADFRILSIHYGVEGYVRADQKQIAEWRGIIARQDKIDLVIGHHAHVVRGVEMAGGSVIFYGLGNFLHHGTANMTGKGICRDWGLMGRVHAVKNAGGKMEIVAVEAIPVTDTHMRPKRLTGADGAARIHALNYLASTLDDIGSGAKGLRFTPQKDGSGLFCMPGAEKAPGKIGQLCTGFTLAPPIPDGLRSRIIGSCAR